MKISVPLFILNLAAFATAAHLEAQTVEPPTKTWSVQVVDRVSNPYYATSFVSLAFNASGNPVLAYADGGNSRMKLATSTASTWNIEVIGRNAGSVSLAMDGNNQPTFAWAYNNLFFSAKAANKWSTTTVDRSMVETYAPPSLAYDNFGNPAVSYRIRNNGREGVGFARRSGSTWTTSIIDGRAAGAYYTPNGWTSLAFNPTDGSPMIAYLDDVNDDASSDTLKFAESTSSGWISQTIESDPMSFGRGSVSLAIFAGQPVIADCINDFVRVVRRQTPSSSWTEQLIDSGARADICIKDKCAYLAYARNGLVKVATAILPTVPTDPTNWTIQTVEYAPATRGKPSIKLGPGNIPYIAYFVGDEVRLAH